MSKFHEIINRKKTSSVKWDQQGGDYIPLWVADMDFLSPEPILEAITKRVQHGVFGYTMIDKELNAIIQNYYKQEYDYEIEKDWIVWLPSVMPGANIACRMAEGCIMYNTPMYSHIRKLPDEAHCAYTDVPLKIENGHYTFDFLAMEEAIKSDTRLFVLCNPHNPVGRVYTYEELETLVAFCEKHDLILLSDEIHCDLILEGKHIPAFTINQQSKERSITLTSAAKTYNLPAIPFAFAIIPNKKLRHKFNETAKGLFPSVPTLAVEAYKAAYSQCAEWKEELIDYLTQNRDYIEERIEGIPGLSINHNEATYLAWIDARATGIKNPYQFFLDYAGIKFSDGVEFGREGFIRVNFGCPRDILKTAFDKVEEALKTKCN